MTDNERVAEIMGWIYDTERDCFINRREGYIDVCIHVFNPLEDPTYDYLVLKHIRDNWDGSQLWIFDGFLIANLAERHPNERDIELFKYYEPGDYSRAAIKVLDGQNVPRETLEEK